MKICAKCGLNRPLECFSHVQLGEGRTRPLSYCHECSAAAGKAWQKQNPGTSKWARRNSERVRIYKRAQARVLRAVRSGRLVRKSACEDCGRGDKPVEAAHYDYNEPLVVRWLCRACHRNWDHEQPKTLGADHVRQDLRSILLLAETES